MIDISFWEQDFKSQASGTRTKFWLFEPGLDRDHAIKYLFKLPTKGTGGHWAEYVGSKIGKELGFNTIEVDLSIYGELVGTISKNFRKRTEEFYEGGDLFLAFFQTLTATH